MKFKSGGKFNLKTGCLIFVIIAIFIYAALTLVQCVQDSRGASPDAKTAPFLVTTTSRVYLAQTGIVIDSAGNTVRKLESINNSYTLSPGEILIMNNWYDMSFDEKWTQHKGESPKLVQLAEGDIKITKREIKETK
jgi:hypothetical protein